MFLFPLGVFFLGVLASRAGGRLLDNAFKANRRGAEIGFYALGANSEVGKWKKSSETESLLFSRDIFTPYAAKSWAREHGFLYGDANIDITDNYIRIRQANPHEFNTLRTIEFRPGVKALIGPKR